MRSSPATMTTPWASSHLIRERRPGQPGLEPTLGLLPAQGGGGLHGIPA